MISYRITKPYEAFWLFGIKLSVIKRRDGNVQLQIHVKPGSKLGQSPPDVPPTADELMALAGV